MDLEMHKSDLMILIPLGLVLTTLVILVPHLLRSHVQVLQMKHEQTMRALEQNQPLPKPDVRSIYAGRTAMLVPMVSVIMAGVVTCFQVAYRPDSVFSVSLSVWSVSGVVSLAAITGGIALLGRLAHLPEEAEGEDMVGNTSKNRCDRD
jgi:hypothetical protein